MTDFRGARGSNTGDAFHELWAVRQAVRLLLNEDGLEAITVEGVESRDETGAPRDAWDGVDCAQYFGGRDAAEAERVQIEQLKYSAANPTTPWTIARLIAGKRGKSVVTRLAKAWKELSTLAPEGTAVSAVLVSNQPLDDGEERVEIDESPYRLLGWLRRSDRDDGIDKKDPFRGYASHVLSRPGRRVTAACGLARDATGRPGWSGGGAKEPMFAYEAWGVADRDDEPYRTDFAVAGQRLLAHEEQLLNFVREQRMDLIVEAEVTRRERRNRSVAGEKGEATREGRFARLYLLDTGENLHVAEGCLGTWTGDGPTA